MTTSYVTDTHSLVWYLAGDARLSTGARRAFDAATQGEAVLLIPAIVIAEIIAVIEKRRSSLDPEQLWGMIERQPNWHIMPLDEARLRCLARLQIGRDIHDRIIACEARMNQATLITKDSEIRAAGVVPVVW